MPEVKLAARTVADEMPLSPRRNAGCGGNIVSPTRRESSAPFRSLYAGSTRAIIKRGGNIARIRNVS